MYIILHIILYAAAARLFLMHVGRYEPREKVKMHKSLDPLTSPPRAKVIRRRSVKASSDIIIRSAGTNYAAMMVFRNVLISGRLTTVKNFTLK